MSNDLITIETVTAVEIFRPGGSKPILEDIKAKVNSIVLDVSTSIGREQIRSLAAKIARSKTTLDNMGKELKAEWKSKCDAIDLERRTIWDELEALQHKVRGPVTDFENKEKKRTEGHEKDLIVLANWANLGASGTSKQAEENLVSLDGSYKSKNWEEFQARAEGVYVETRGSLVASCENLKKQEEERAELERLRREEYAREQIAKEDAFKERQAAAVAEALEAEKKRLAYDEQCEKEAQARREADKTHKAEIHNEILKMLIGVVDVSQPADELAKNIIIAIATGKIPHVKINY